MSLPLTTNLTATLTAVGRVVVLVIDLRVNPVVIDVAAVPSPTLLLLTLLLPCDTLLMRADWALPEMCVAPAPVAKVAVERVTAPALRGTT